LSEPWHKKVAHSQGVEMGEARGSKETVWRWADLAVALWVTFKVFEGEMVAAHSWARVHLWAMWPRAVKADMLPDPECGCHLVGQVT